MRELEEANRREKDKKMEWETKREGQGAAGGSEGDDEEGGSGSGSGTETEDAGAGTATEQAELDRHTVEATGVGGLRPAREEADVRKRRSVGEGSSAGDLSTDSEWDKIEEARDIRR